MLSEAIMAFAQGYYDGRSTGVIRIDMDDKSDMWQTIYHEGYERGVGDYCREVVDENKFDKVNKAVLD